VLSGVVLSILDLVAPFGRFPASGTRETNTQRQGKPCLHLSAERDGANAAALLQEFVQAQRIGVLNVAGSRGSKEPDVCQFVTDVLQKAFDEEDH